MPDWKALSDEAVVDALAAFEATLKDAADNVAQGKAEVLKRCEYREATALHGRGAVARVKKGTATYDKQKLRQLLEHLREPDVRRAYTEAHKVTIDVPEKWDGTQLRRIERECGGAVKDIIEDARLEGASSVVIETLA